MLLRQPYPFYLKGNTLWIIAAIIFLMSFIFNYFFQPFNVYTPEHKFNYFWISIIHSVTPIIVLLLFFIVLRLILKMEDVWTVGKEMLALVLAFLCVGIGQFLIRDIIYDNPNNWSWGYFFEEIRNTFLVGILFVSILVPLNWNRLYRHNSSMATAWNNKRNSTVTTKDNASVFITTQVKADNFELDVSRFLFAKAEGNYLEIFQKKNDSFEKLVKRIPIKEFEAQLGSYPAILKTHRSYLVNLNEINAVAGNAQGYQLSGTDFPEKVPVSRNKISVFEKRMQAL